MKKIISTIALFSALCAACSNIPTSLVPDTPSGAPDYFCTWNVQGYAVSYTGGTNTRAVINEQYMFGAEKFENWAELFPEIRADLYFVMDDSWDIPQDVNNTPNEYLGLTELDASRFPSFTGTPTQRLKKLTKKVKSLGWKGLGGWICAQEAEMVHVPANADSVEAYWTERLQAADEAGFAYWKVDWGHKDRNDEWRKNLTAWGRTHAPNLVIEHAMKGKYIEFSDVFRTYDVENITATPVTIQRVADLLKYSAQGDAAGIVNCEDEPYIAAGLGCAIGVMRHPFNGNLPDGRQDHVFPPVGRDYKSRLDEVIRGVRWHRIAEPFGVADDAHIDTVKLQDYWDIRPNESYVGHKDGERLHVSAPARVSRNMPLPEIAADSTTAVPFVMASRYPNGATAIVTTERTLGRECVLNPVAVTVKMSDWYKPIGIFGLYESLVLDFDNEIGAQDFTVLGQDLAGELAIDITDRVSIQGTRMIVPGELINEIGLMAAREGDKSTPGMVLQIFAQ